MKQSKKFRQDCEIDWNICNGSHWAELDAYTVSAKFWNNYAGRTVARMVKNLRDLQAKIQEWRDEAQRIWWNWENGHPPTPPTPEDKEKVAQHIKDLEKALQEMKEFLKDFEFIRNQLDEIWDEVTKVRPGNKFPYIKEKDMDKKPWDMFLGTFNEAVRNVNKAISAISSIIPKLEAAIAQGKVCLANDPPSDWLLYFHSLLNLEAEHSSMQSIFDILDDWYTTFDIDAWVDEVHFLCMLEWFTSHSRKPFHWFWSFFDQKEQE